jgi:endonuclease YncB( thermonuclease family)
MQIKWSRLLPARQRIIPFWAIAGLAVAVPWLIAGQGIDFLGAAEGPASACTVQSIYDGDTMRAVCDGEQIKIRLNCIDTPEMGQRPWGTESRDYLRRITPERFSLVRLDKDRYGRIIGNVFDGDINLNLEMVAAGQAAVYVKYCTAREFYDAERGARQQGLGIWEKEGLQQRPWEWRKR